MPRLTNNCQRPGIIHKTGGSNRSRKMGMKRQAAAAGRNCSIAWAIMVSARLEWWRRERPCISMRTTAAEKRPAPIQLPTKSVGLVSGNAIEALRERRGDADHAGDDNGDGAIAAKGCARRDLGTDFPDVGKRLVDVAHGASVCRELCIAK